MKRLLTLSTILFAACGDDSPAQPDAGVTPDMEVMADAPIDAPVWTAPIAFPIAISAGGPDQIMDAVPGPQGSFYVAGHTADTATGTKYLFVAKLTSAGALDTTFGTSSSGIYVSTLEFRGSSDEVDIAVQSTGKIVVAGSIPALTANDKDIGLFRVDATGALDTAFAGTGTARINLSTAIDSGGLKGLDASRDVAIGPNDQIFLHAASRDEVEDNAMSIDTDFTVARLTADGVLDTANYGTLGKTLVDIDDVDATVRALHVFSDGSVVGSGYARNTTVAGATVQPVLYRLTPAGALDTNFASGGRYHELVLTAQTEIYSFAVHTNDITTAGYGREDAAGSNVWTPMRFNAQTGARLTNFGGATAGVPLIDPSNGTAGNNCRNAVALPGGKTALFGSTGDSASRDAAFAVLTQNGTLDTSYGTGKATWSLGGTEDQWWGGAVNNGKLLLVGWRGVTTQADTAGQNDDSYGVLIPMQ